MIGRRRHVVVRDGHARPRGFPDEIRRAKRRDQGVSEHREQRRREIQLDRLQPFHEAIGDGHHHHVGAPRARGDRDRQGQRDIVHAIFRRATQPVINRERFVRAAAATNGEGARIGRDGPAQGPVQRQRVERRFRRLGIGGHDGHDRRGNLGAHHDANRERLPTRALVVRRDRSDRIFPRRNVGPDERKPRHEIIGRERNRRHPAAAGQPRAEQSRARKELDFAHRAILVPRLRTQGDRCRRAETRAIDGREHRDHRGMIRRRRAARIRNRDHRARREADPIRRGSRAAVGVEGRRQDQFQLDRFGGFQHRIRHRRDDNRGASVAGFDDHKPRQRRVIHAVLRRAVEAVKNRQAAIGVAEMPDGESAGDGSGLRGIRRRGHNHDHRQERWEKTLLELGVRRQGAEHQQPRHQRARKPVGKSAKQGRFHRLVSI